MNEKIIENEINQWEKEFMKMNDEEIDDMLCDMAKTQGEE